MITIMNPVNSGVTETQSYVSYQRLTFWFMLTASIVLCAVTIIKKDQSWDILGYAGAVKSFETSDAKEIHSYVYQSFHEYASEDELYELIEATDYRKTMSVDVDAFNQQIPFYKIRVLFVGLISLVASLGINVMFAGHIVAAVTGMMGLMAYYFAFRQLIHPAFWLLVPILFVVLAGLELTRAVTADPMAFLWSGLIFLALMKKRWLFLYLLLITSVLVRTDMILFVALIAAYLFFYQPSERLRSGIAFLLSFMAYMWVNQYAGNYGWGTVFYFALVSDMSATHPVEYSKLGLSVSDYIHQVVINVGGFIDETPLLLYQGLILFLLILFILHHRYSTARETISGLLANRLIVLNLVGALYVVVHYLLFPLIENRFFVAMYIFTLLSLLAVISQLVEANKVQ